MRSRGLDLFVAIVGLITFAVLVVYRKELPSLAIPFGLVGFVALTAVVSAPPLADAKATVFLGVLGGFVSGLIAAGLLWRGHRTGYESVFGIGLTLTGMIAGLRQWLCVGEALGVAKAAISSIAVALMFAVLPIAVLLALIAQACADGCDL